jgi:heme-degrading monooxygenase HmoA
MIARLWRGEAEASNGDAYARHFTTSVAPRLEQIPGHKGAYLLRREAKGQVEFLAFTLWESIEAIKGFAGQDPEAAVAWSRKRAPSCRPAMISCAITKSPMRALEAPSADYSLSTPSVTKRP